MKFKPKEKHSSKNKNLNSELNIIDSIEEDSFLDLATETKAKPFNQEKLYLPNTSLLGTKSSLPMTKEDISLIKSSLSNHFLFNQLNEKMINVISKELLLFQLSKGSVLFSENEKGYFFYIVKSGKLELKISNQEHTKIFTKGDTFGEMALLQKTERSGTVTCLEDSEMYFLDGKIFRDTVYQINKEDFLIKLNLINSISLFEYIDSIYLNKLVDKMIKNIYDKDTVIFNENDRGASLYIIKEGNVICEKNGAFIRELGQNDFFGENSLLFDSPRTMTIKTKTKCKMYQITQKDLQICLGEKFREILISSFIKNALQATRYLKYLLINDFLEKLQKKMTLKKYKSGDIIYNHRVSMVQNAADDREHKMPICIIISGNISFGEENYSRGSIVGEDYLPRGKTRNYITHDFKADTDLIVYQFFWCDIVSVINIDNLKENKILQFFEVLSHIKKIQLLRHISEFQLLEISKKLTKQTYLPNDEIIKEGTKGDNIYFLYRGKIQIFKDKKFIREYQDYACFGEIGVLKNINHTASVIAVTKASVYLLTKEDFFRFIDGSMLKYLSKKLALMDTFNLDLNKLYFSKELGKGKFGSVSLVYDNQHKNVYAIKAVSKEEAEKKKILTRYFQKEREILLTLDHPFIVKLIKTFQNKKNVFYLMEYINGFELNKYLSSRKDKSLKNRKETQFYAGSLLVVINYLNSKNLIHRDIKPDNIMINENGYITVIDFNTCSEIKDLTSTLVGARHYIAPEILLGKGYGMSVDYWSIGVVAYKIYYGTIPFGKGMSDPVDIYRDILWGTPTFPEEDEASEFIGNLLKKNVWERTCNLELIKKEKFFSDFSWNDLIDLKIIPTFIPPTKAINIEECYKKGNEVKYVDYLEQQQKKNEEKQEKKKSDVDHDEIDKEEIEKYNPDWAKDF